MGFFRRIAGFLGFAKEDEVVKDQEDGIDDHNHNNTHTQQQHDYVRFRSNFQETGLPRKPFGVPVQVPVDRPHLVPVLAPCSSSDGGVQGLRWYARRLRIDEDGDVADEFLDEVLPDTSSSTGDQQKPVSRFEVKYRTIPAKIRNQVISDDGKMQHVVEYQGRLQWV